MGMLEDIARFLEEGDEDNVSASTQAALKLGLAPKEILERGLIAGMNVVGERFREREIFLPDVLMAAKAMTAGLEHLTPLLAEGGVVAKGKVVIGTVSGDLHDIGKNLVAIMLKGAGFEVVDLGKDISPQAFVDAAVKEKAGFIGMSALLTTTMPVMKDVVALARKNELLRKVKIVIGGAPVSEEYAREIGADLYAFDAASAVDRVRAAADR